MAKRKGMAGGRDPDMSRPEWEDWPEKGAEHAIRWIETYCRLPKGYGAGKPIVLAEFQKAWLRTVMAPDVVAAVMAVPRGNGKSTFLACVGLYFLFNADESGAPQVPVIATTIGQAVKSVYGVAEQIVRAHPELERRVLPYSGMGTQRLETPFNNGELFPKSNDPDGLQGLDPSLGVVDEIGFMPLDSWNSLLMASGKRPKSLIVGIGTPGFDRLVEAGQPSALWSIRERVQAGNIDPGFVFTEFAADEGCDIHDESQWLKANPLLAEEKMNIGSLRMTADMPPESHFRIFHLGQWVSGVESWLGSDGKRIWAALTDPYEFRDDAPTWIGVDVATEHDTTAVVICQRRPDDRYHVKAKIWTPGSHGSVDVADVMQFLREQHARWKRNLRVVAYDPRLFDVPARMLEDERLPMLKFDQTLERMTPAAGGALEMIMRGEVSHDGDDAFSWQVLNGVARPNERGFMLSRAKSKDKIDACVAMLMALAEATHELKPPEVSVEFW